MKQIKGDKEMIIPEKDHNLKMKLKVRDKVERSLGIEIRVMKNQENK
jgi:hypothetical protein